MSDKERTDWNWNGLFDHMGLFWFDDGHLPPFQRGLYRGSIYGLVFTLPFYLFLFLWIFAR